MLRRDPFSSPSYIYQPESGPHPPPSAPPRYVRFRWLQAPSHDVSGAHRWSLRDVYIGRSCPKHCLGRGSCLFGACRCDAQYAGDHCQRVVVDNVVRWGRRWVVLFADASFVYLFSRLGVFSFVFSGGCFLCAVHVGFRCCLTSLFMIDVEE